MPILGDGKSDPQSADCHLANVQDEISSMWARAAYGCALRIAGTIGLNAHTMTWTRSRSLLTGLVH